MNRTTASDILKNWKDKEYITTEYTAVDGSKCYRTYGDTAFYALLCERYGLEWEWKGDFHYSAKGNGFTLDYVERDIILSIEKPKNEAEQNTKNFLEQIKNN